MDKTLFYNSTSFVSATGPSLSNLNGLSSVFFQGNSSTAQVLQGPLSSFSGYTGFPNVSFYLSIFAVGTLSTPSISGYFPTLVGAGARAQFYGGARLGQLSTGEANVCVFPTSTINSNYSAIPSYNSSFLVSHTAVQFATSTVTFLGVNGTPQTRCIAGVGSGFSTIGSYTLGGSLSTFTDFRDAWTGQIGEVLMYATTDVLSWSERQVIEGYLTTKWRFQTALPPTHPYRTTPVSLRTPTSAQAITTLSTSRSVILPTTSSLGSQMIYITPTNQSQLQSTVALTASSNEYIGLEPSLVLNDRAQSALLVNPVQSNSWIVHSKSVNNPMYSCTLPILPYVPYSNMSMPTARGFGSCIALSSNGDIVVGGAWDTNAPSVSGAGAVYIYKKNTATGQYSTFQTALFASDPKFGSRFGGFVAISEDSTYVFATASNYNGAIFSAVGAVYVYKKNATTDIWSQVTRLDPPAENQFPIMQFGKSLATSSNADYLFIGANASSITGVVGVGAIYPYKKVAGTDSWTNLPRIVNPYPVTQNNGFANTLSVTPDAVSICTGAPLTSFAPLAANINERQANVGVVASFVKDASTDKWDFTQLLTASDWSGNKSFGTSTALSRNGLYLIVNRTPTDASKPVTYVYKRTSASDLWSFASLLQPQTPYSLASYGSNRLGSGFGPSCAVSENADYILVGADGNTGASGQVFFYQKQAGTDSWEQRNIILPRNPTTVNNYFGNAVAITPTGSFFGIAQYNVPIGLNVYQQSTIGTISLTNTFTFVDTTSPSKTMLLPHPSTNPGQLLYIKDTKNNGVNYPMLLSTTGGSFITSTISNFSFYTNNGCIQLQSDGSNLYTLLNLFSGDEGPQAPAYNFRSFWVRGSVSTPLYNYPVLVPINIRFNIASNVYPDTISFRDSDSTTTLPFWVESYTPNIGTYALYWVRLPYIPPYPLERQYFVYWNCNCNFASQQRPQDVFLFFDDFKGTAGTTPDPTKWYTLSQGSSNTTQRLTGYQSGIRLMGDTTGNTNAGLLLRTPTLSNNFSVRFSFFTSTFATVAIATTSTPQFLTTGGQSNWWWTTLGNGYTFQFSTINTRRFLYSQAQGVAAVSLRSNVSGYTPSLKQVYDFSFTNQGRIEVLSSDSNVTAANGMPNIIGTTSIVQTTSTSYLTSSKYVFIGQGTQTGFLAQSSIYTYVAIRPYVYPEPSYGVFSDKNVL